MEFFFEVLSVKSLESSLILHGKAFILAFYGGANRLMHEITDHKLFPFHMNFIMKVYEQ